MKSKKKNDLALELVDDVLGVTETQHKKTKSKTLLKKKKKNKKSSSSAEADNTVEFTVNSSEASRHHVYKNQQDKIAIGQDYPPPLKRNNPDVYLAQTENLRFAQEKILELEDELERLRGENEELAAAGETFKNRADDLSGQIDQLNVEYKDKIELLENERNILSQSLSEKDKQVVELNRQEKEYAMRLSSNIQKIRVRERELENRLEILKVENSAILRNKDEMILDLKRQLDHYENEISKYKDKVLELNNFLNEKKADTQRTIKALRMALSLLEGQSGAKASIDSVNSAYDDDNDEEDEGMD